MFTQKKMGVAFFCTLILFFLMSMSEAMSLEVDSKAAILIDQKTGKILYEKNIKEKLPIASTTKILTSISAIELALMDEEVIISNHVAEVGEASIDLIEGEKISLQNLLLGMMLRSGNDAAVAIAELVAGSEQEFVQIMNKKAITLGAVDSHFANPNGLPAKDHYSTAYDLALIAKYAMDNPVFREIVSIKVATIPYNNKGWNRYLRNTNQLLWQYAEATGIKTGTTDAAGPCLVASAKRNETSLIAVVLNSRDRFNDTMKLLKWGLDNYQTVAQYEKGQIFTTLPIPDGKPEAVDIILNNGIVYTKKQEQTVKKEIKWNELKLPINKGQIVGKIIFTVGEDRYIVELISADEVLPKSFLEKVSKVLKGKALTKAN